jgi:hypothetical protein
MVQVELRIVDVDPDGDGMILGVREIMAGCADEVHKWSFIH